MIVGQVVDGDTGKQAQDTFVNFAERLAHRAQVALIALGVFGEALGQDDWAVDGADHFQGGDVARFASQAIAAARALFGNQKASAGEFLQDFREQRERDAVSVGNILGARGALRGGQVAESDESVIRFFSELQHLGSIRSDFQYRA